MTTSESDKVKRIIVGRYVDWVKRFDVYEYVQNPPMIEKLYEERQLALLSSLELEKRIGELEAQNNDLRLQNQKLTLQVKEARQRSFLMFLLSLIATVLVGVGVNIATSTPYGWTGWIMIASGCILEIIAFISRP
jgi:hypothetical protein